MLKRKLKSLVYYQFNIFGSHKSYLNHGIFSGHILKKTDSFRRLNVQSPEPGVISERSGRLLCRCLACDRNQLISVNQVHGRGLIIVDRPDLAYFTSRPGDAMLTNIPSIHLVIQTADCLPLLLYSPDTKSIAAIHAGWRGLKSNIIEQTIRKWKAAFAADPASITAGLGPSLGPCCAEFINRQKEFPAQWRPYFLADSKVDLWEVAMKQLIASGIKSDNIELSRICTKCHHNRWFSWRAEKASAGRFASVIGLRNNGA